MKKISMFLAAFLGFAVSSGAFAQNPIPSPFDAPFQSPFATAVAPAAKSLDDKGLGDMLSGMGYRTERFELKGCSGYKVTLKHRTGDRVHMLAVDKDAKTILLIGGGFEYIPDAKLASNAWFQRLLKINIAIAPCQIFLNDHGVFGMTSVLGNDNVTPDQLRKLIATHVDRFDNQLEPLAREIASQPNRLGINP